MSDLNHEFEALGDTVDQLIALLEESGHRFWVPYLKRGLAQIRENKLSGATFVLGCYGGEETFSDLVIGSDVETSDPLRFRNLNARLSHLRNQTFEHANVITSRRSW